ncbi:hypothetical protein A2U01_0041952 [Trifolium medium]|uniref:Uncharacterized protein n=1 Tax=Trifolium medium TaxID=97028 RepID=A0A392QA92_9FABA|nr:hypothetical protein [Trifolium medium]
MMLLKSLAYQLDSSAFGCGQSVKMIHFVLQGH